MLSTFQFASSGYFFALLPSVYTVRQHFPPGTRMHVTLFLGTEEPVDAVVLNYLNELRIDLELVHISETNVSRDSVLHLCNRHFVRVLERSGYDDVFYLDADCYFRRPPTWDRIEGDVIFGSLESPRERAPKTFPDFCERLRVRRFINEGYFGSCVYVKAHAKHFYAQEMKSLLEGNVPFHHFDDMHYRFAAASLAGLRCASAPKELEYKVVFDYYKSHDPEMLHLCFSLDWYQHDPCYHLFLSIIAEVVDQYPALIRNLHPLWVEHCCGLPGKAAPAR